MPSSSAADGLRPFEVAGNPPVHRVDFSELSELDVIGFDVHVDDVFAVCKGDGVAEFVEDLEILVDGVLADFLFPRCSLDVLHRVEEGPVGGPSQLVHGGDVGVFQLSGDLGFIKKLLGKRFGLLVFADDLQCNFTLDGVLHC